MTYCLPGRWSVALAFDERYFPRAACGAQAPRAVDGRLTAATANAAHALTPLGVVVVAHKRAVRGQSSVAAFQDAASHARSVAPGMTPGTAPSTTACTRSHPASPSDNLPPDEFADPTRSLWPIFATERPFVLE